MKVTRICTTCNSGKFLRFRIELPDGDIGWHCNKCQTFWGLQYHEVKLYTAVAKDTAKQFEQKKKAIAKLKQSMIELGIVESNQL